MGLGSTPSEMKGPGGLGMSPRPPFCSRTGERYPGLMTIDMIRMITLGRQVVDNKELVALRERLGFSRNLMSELFHVNPMTYAGWERGPGAKLKPLVAEKIGRFYVQAQEAMTQLEEEGIHLKDLVPFHLVAAAAGLPQEVLLMRYREGEVEGIELGMLGLWLHRTDLVLLGVDGE